MRNKIIAVNVLIMAIVGFMSFVLMRSSIMSAASNTPALLDEAKHNALGAGARLQLDGLKVERWLAVKSADPSASDALNKADPKAAGVAATALCDAVAAAAKTAPEFDGRLPSLVLLTNDKGITQGRNGSELRRGEDLGATYPIFKSAIQKGASGSDVWSNKVDQVLASYAPVKNEKGQVVGALIVGIQLSDELSRVADSTTGRPLVLVAAEKEGVEILARSAANTSALDEAVTKGAKDHGAMDAVRTVLDKGHVDAAQAGDMVVGAAPLEGLGDGKSKAMVASEPAVLIENASALATPLLGVAALGIALVVIGGWLLGSYISAPIARLEEGLLAIINGQTDKRFQLEHAELGGLAFRIDQLLNQLLGVEEDTTDEEGRISRAPSAAAMEAAMGGGSSTPDLDAAAVASLASEPADQYYARIFREYIAAKQALGQQTDHITQQQFQQRIQSMELETSQRQGKPVRYKVQTSGGDVILLAVPLS